MITTQHNGDTITVLLAARSINPLSRLFQRELGDLLDQLESRHPHLGAIQIGFDANAADPSHELEHLMALTPAQAADCMHMLASYNALLCRLEGMGVPVSATLGGDVCGHALGLALACHRRIALADAHLSLPQVLMGLAPVAGEIARTVRLTGVQAAMPLLLDGARLNATQALQAGLVHKVVGDESELADALGDTGAAAVQPWETKNHQLPGGGLDAPAVRALLQTAPAMLRQRAGGTVPAAEAVLCAMVEGLRVDFANALRIESRYFCQTAINQAHRKGGFSL
ncbi:enoyl-CoA hydratase/isomerase family protein [Duganella sp. BuS-21]|uniref:enoyl-CoA hydratase/isomerase family protein n=1 Tax=Duganella sp. BuS-21 TaxID=2943848 RepID=UPI0035A5C3F5